MLSHTNNISEASKQFRKIVPKAQNNDKIVKKQNYKLYVSLNFLEY